MQRLHKPSLQLSSATTAIALYEKRTTYYLSMPVPSLEIPSSCVLVKLGVLKRDDIYGVLAHEDGGEKKKR